MDQIEVIDRQGEVAFYKLDPMLGVSTIGRNPHAEILLPGSEVASVHAMLYHRDANCQLVVYAENGAPTTRNNAVVPPNLSCTLNDGDTLQIGTYLLVYFKDGWDEGRWTEARFTVPPLAITETPKVQPRSTGDPDLDEEDAALLRSTRSTAPYQPVHPWFKARLLEEEVVARTGDHAVFAMAFTYEVNTDAPPEAVLRVSWLRLRQDGQRLPLNGVFEVGEVKPVVLRQGDTATVNLALKLNRVLPGRYPLIIHIESKDYRIGTIRDVDTVLWVYPKDMADTANPPNLQVQLLEPEVVADTTFPAIFNATLHNSGPKEAQCLLSVEPCFPFRLNPNETTEEMEAKAKWHRDWSVEHLKIVNLHNDERRTIEVRINVAQARSMVSGIYPFKLIVRSLAYSNSSCMAIGRLVLPPTTAFDVRDEQLVREPLKVTYHARQGQAQFVISNQSNRPATFVVNALDRTGEFDFKFAESTSNSPDALSPASFLIPPNDTKTITIKANLREGARRFIAPIWRTHDVTMLTTMLVEPPLAPKQSLMQIKSKPFWLVWEALAVLVALAGLLMGIALAISWPRDSDWIAIARRPTSLALNQGNGVTQSTTASITVRAVEETALIIWQPQLFSDWRWRLVAQPQNGEPATLAAPPDGKTYTDQPLITTTYTLVPDNPLTEWLDIQTAQVRSRPFIREILALTQPIRRQVTASVPIPLPGVVLSATNRNVVFGNPAVIKWTVQGRTIGLTLDVNGDQTVLPSEDVLKTQSRVIPFEKLTLPDNAVKFFADNEFKQKEPSKQITITVLPRINSLTAEPQTIIVGEKVRIAWDVSSRSQITLEIPGSAPERVDPKGEREITPATAQTLTIKIISLETTDSTAFEVIPRSEFSRQVSITVKPKPKELTSADCVGVFLDPQKTVQAGSPEAGRLRLRWDVAPDPNSTVSDTIEISGPGIGTIPVLGNKGDLPVPASQSGVFVFKVVRAGVQSLICPLELVVLPPPPTATPLPPPPIIKVFTVRAAKDTEAANVTLDLSGGSSGAPLYTVIAGTRLAFSWDVDVPVDTVKFNNSPVPNPASYELLPVGSSEQVYVLEAMKAGQRATATIRIKLKERVPPPPLNLRLSKDTGKWTLTWSYPAESRDHILGFRIKRSLGNGDGLTEIAREDVLKPSTLSWELTPTELENDLYRCNLYYYVVAVYTDANGDPAESFSPSTGSVFTGACANPTPIITLTPSLPPDLQSVSDPSNATPTPIP